MQYELIKKFLVKIIGYSFIFLFYFFAAIVIFIFTIEIGGFKLFITKEQMSGLNLYETKYYGKSLQKDPYEKFTIQYLHPYYFFSLPYREIDRQKANNDYVSVGADGFRQNPFKIGGGD